MWFCYQHPTLPTPQEPDLASRLRSSALGGQARIPRSPRVIGRGTRTSHDHLHWALFKPTTVYVSVVTCSQAGPGWDGQACEMTPVLNFPDCGRVDGAVLSETHARCCVALWNEDGCATNVGAHAAMRGPREVKCSSSWFLLLGKRSEVCSTRTM